MYLQFLNRLLYLDAFGQDANGKIISYYGKSNDVLTAPVNVDGAALLEKLTQSAPNIGSIEVGNALTFDGKTVLKTTDVIEGNTQGGYHITISYVGNGVQVPKGTQQHLISKLPHVLSLHLTGADTLESGTNTTGTNARLKFFGDDNNWFFHYRPVSNDVNDLTMIPSYHDSVGKVVVNVDNTTWSSAKAYTSKKNDNTNPYVIGGGYNFWTGNVFEGFKGQIQMIQVLSWNPDDL